MPPSATKSNYKTYESQARLVRAMVAAHPEVKWNCKAIIRCFGTDLTEHALNHRFRVIRTHCEIIQRGLRQGFDMQDLPAEPPGNPRTIESIDDKQIAKYFGSSTGDGINYQFRSIKADAKHMKEAADSGSNPKDVPLTTGTVPSTDPTSALSTPRKKTAARTPRSRATGRKSAAKNGVPPLFDIKQEDDDGSDTIVTPTKTRDKVMSGRVNKKTPRPPREAASRASAIITQQASPPKDDFANVDADDSADEAFAVKTEPIAEPITVRHNDREHTFSPQLPDPAPASARASSSNAIVSNGAPSKSASASTSYKPARTSLFGGPQTPVSAGGMFNSADEIDSSFGLPTYGFSSFGRTSPNDPLDNMDAPTSFDVDFSFTDGEF